MTSDSQKKDTVIVKIKAGLGNQMFQYACGRAMAARNNSILKLDITDWTHNREKIRHYLLSNFNIEENIATDAEINRFRNKYGTIISKIIRGIKVRLSISYTNFYPRIFSATGDIYLDGYWQTEQYFKGQEDVIRKEFTPRNPLGGAAAAMQARIQAAAMPISVHVRRGDNAHSPASMRRFGMPTNEYYTKAPKLIYEKIKSPSPTLFLFSDDIPWMQENLHFDFPVVYVSALGIADWEEILLMSACRHHVIANSTFSWWGAWLNPRTDKVVVAPKRWALRKNYLHKDLIPSSWIRL